MTADLGTRKPPHQCRVRRVVAHRDSARNAVHNNRFRPMATRRVHARADAAKGWLPSMRTPLREVAGRAMWRSNQARGRAALMRCSASWRRSL